MRQDGRNHGSPRAGVVVLGRQHLALVDDEVQYAAGVEVPPEQALGGIFNVDGVGLARAVDAQAVAAVVEEGPEPAAVDVDVVPAAHELVPRHAAVGVVGRAVGEGRVAVARVGGPGGGGLGWAADALPVGRLALLHADEEVSGIGKVVLVQRVVLKGSAYEPDGILRFDQHSSAGADDLRVGAVEIVVGGPTPHVLDIGRRRGCEMEQEESRFAGIGCICAFRLSS